MTSAEEILWERIRAGKLNKIKFRRQHLAGKYILDFYCYQYKLVIELDGEVHDCKDQIERDLGRTEDLMDLGLNVLRFKNDEVLENSDHVLSLILNHIEILKRTQK